ncbi:MAG TPA: PHP-associated domain-containing protein [Candidatus Paceibacterota bacterium]|nr:PHP-associated domain-containing protein [Candidatus Paceibacterota bacterium]
MLKINLHFHSAEDTRHLISYSLREALDKAHEQHFDALALTCHRRFAYNEANRAYAAAKGILLIPGIEADIYDETGRSAHVIILNGDKDTEQVRTFPDLRSYKQSHPECFVLAPHPYFYGSFSLQENLEKNIDLFDAIEHSWFYTTFFNRNKKARMIAEKYRKPFIATSDAHFLEVFESDYALVDTDQKTPEAIFTAIKAGLFQNISKPRNVIGTFVRFGWYTLVEECRLLLKRRV